ncbi:MAG: hypothetical protein ACPKPY_05540 [Nitrososphaeraceae archaeon]
MVVGNEKNYKTISDNQLELLAQDLTPSELEVFRMWLLYKKGIMPNQYHPSYDEGQTIIYPEHIADINTIDKFAHNKQKKLHQQTEAKRKQNTMLDKLHNRSRNSRKFKAPRI